MKLVRFSPFAEIETMQRQMNTLFDELTGWHLDTTKLWKPSIELLDRDKELVLRAALPGLEAKDIDISVTREAVTLTGESRYEKETEDQGYYHSEFSYGKFERTIALPVEIDNEGVIANFANGVLTLTLPKIVANGKKVVKIALDKEPEAVLEGAAPAATEG